MKNSMKKYLLSTLALSTAFCGLLGVKALGAKADEPNPFENFGIADVNVRTDDIAGIRFVTDVTADQLAAATQFGTVVIPKAKLQDGDIANLVVENEDVANIVTEKWLDEEQSAYAGVIVGKNADGELINLPEEFYDDVLVARSYAVVGGEYVYSTKFVEKSIAQVASEELIHEDNAFLQSIVDEVVPSLAWDVDALELYMLGESAAASITTDVKGLTVKYESTDENVAKYVDGKIVPVGEGTAAIVASIGSTTASVEVKVGARQFASGVLNDFLSTQDSGGGNWHGYSTPTVINLADKGISAPTTADGYTGPLTKQSAVEWKVNGQGQVSNWINLYNFYENINSYRNSDYIEIWIYMDMAECTAQMHSTIYTTVAGAWGTDGSNSGGVAWDNYYNNNGLPALQKWSKITISVAELKASMATNDIKYGGLGIALRPMVDASKGASVYLYSVELHTTPIHYFAEGEVVQDFTSTENFGYGGWAKGATPAVINLTDAGLSAPTATDGYTGKVTKTTVMNLTFASDSQCSPYLPMPNVFQNIDYCNDLDYISIWVYFDAVSATTFTQAKIYAATDKNFLIGSNTGDPVAYQYGKVATNKWVELKYTVAQLKASMKEGHSYNGFGFYLGAPNDANLKDRSIYYYVAEYHKYSSSVNFVDTNVLKNTPWGSHGSVEAVATPAEIGVPEGKTDNGTLVKKTCNGKGEAWFELTTGWHTAKELAAVLDDNDVIRFWVYVETTATEVNKHFFRLAPNRDWGKNTAGRDTADGVAIGEWTAWDITGAELKAELALYTHASTDVSFLLLLRTATQAQTNYYFHSAEIVKVD